MKQSSDSVCALPLTHPLRHGDRVLTNFFRNLTKLDHTQTISLYGLFETNGQTHANSWAQALESAHKRKSAFIASAIALPLSESTRAPLGILPPMIVASGQWGGRIKEETKLFPHEMIIKNQVPRENALVIGSYFLDDAHQEAFSDQTLLYKDLINYSFAMSDEIKKEMNLSGSSYALAVAIGRLMSLCESKLRPFKRLQECLKNKSVSVSTVSHELLYQF